MNVFGYAGKVLHVDLGSEQFEIKDIDLIRLWPIWGDLGGKSAPL